MIRAIFFILLLANLGAYAWYHWYVAPSSVALQPSQPPGGKPLQLMSELTPAERKSVAQNAPAEATAPAVAAVTHAVPAAGTGAGAAAAQACVSYGPFPSADAAGQGMTRLKTAGLNPSQRTVPGKAKRGYWVFLPPFGSRREADAAADLLRKKDVKDIYVVADEANRNAVSLGVFSQKDGAIQREKDIRKLGFKAQMTERFRDEPRYWLDTKGPDSALPAAEAFKDLSDEATPIGKASTACGA